MKYRQTYSWPHGYTERAKDECRNRIFNSCPDASYILFPWGEEWFREGVPTGTELVQTGTDGEQTIH